MQRAPNYEMNVDVGPKKATSEMNVPEQRGAVCVTGRCATWCIGSVTRIITHCLLQAAAVWTFVRFRTCFQAMCVNLMIAIPHSRLR